MDFEEISERYPGEVYHWICRCAERRVLLKTQWVFSVVVVLQIRVEENYEHMRI